MDVAWAGDKDCIAARASDVAWAGDKVCVPARALEWMRITLCVVDGKGRWSPRDRMYWKGAMTERRSRSGDVVARRELVARGIV